MSHSKLSMIQRFADEKEFRAKLLESLFQRMKFETMHNHGINEFGKDFVLISYDELNSKKYTGVVVKKGNVSVSKHAKHNNTLIDDISRQMREVFSIKYFDTLTKQAVTVDKAYFVCDGNISDNAKRKIIEQWGNSSELYEKNTTFISGENLVKLIEDKWPLFFSSFTPEFNEYADKLLLKLESEDKGRNININSNISMLSEKYLQCNLYEISHDGVGKIKFLPKNLDNVFEKKHCILIVGPSGTGKSHLLRDQIKKAIIIESQNGSTPRFKVYIKLSELGDKELTVDEINHYIYDVVKKVWDGISPEYLNNFISDKHIDFYLDGFDEIASEEKRSIATLNINTLISMYSTSQIVVTTRMVSVKLKQGLSSRFVRYDIKQLSYQDSINYLQNVVREISANGDEILKEIHQQGIMQSLPRTPLTLQLISSLFSDNASKEIPSNITEVYKMYTEIMLGRWDKHRDVTNSYDYEQKVTLLSEIAYYLQTNCIECVTYKKANELTMEFLREMGDDASKSESIIDEITDRSELIRYDEIDNCFNFKHRSFQEYFTAYKIHNEGRNFTEIVNHIADPWWDSSIVFLCGFRKKANELIDYVINFSCPENMAESIFRFRRGANLGLMIRAGYQSSHKKEAINQALDDFEVCYTSGELQEKFRNIAGKIAPDFFMHIALQIVLSSSFYSKLTKTAVIEIANELENACKLALLTHLITEYEEKETLKSIADKVRTSDDNDIKKACYFVTEQFINKSHIKLLESKEMRKLKKSSGILLENSLSKYSK